ncbi:hypothetical protein EV178_002049 [Coemansia sp. RSA 1646]|nr:hypothetical protein EV178_002049 [Coemansia sp. RSA 1646]
MADDDWQTVPERQPRRQQQQQRGGRGRGGYRGAGSEVGRNNQGGERRGYSREGYARDTGHFGASDGNWRTPSTNRDTSVSRTQPRSRSRPSRKPSSQSAAPPPPPPQGGSFKLQTSNMFEVHVSKGSRARKHEELKEFFETRDDDDEEDTFDAIDDDDLDLSGYESEDDADEATSFPPVPIQIKCPFCAPQGGKVEQAEGGDQDKKKEAEGDKEDKQELFTSAVELTAHLRDAHGLAFKNLNHMALMLQRYLDAWAEKLATDKDSVAGEDDADKEIRDRVQRENLDSVLAIQAAERRTEAQDPRKCLFCKLVCDNRANLFKHGYREHNFNIGLPDNLVNVTEFLQILESKLRALQCLYCEKTFTSAAVLRKHMRKKKHFKISSHNRLYDRFYIVNYLEPGKSWEAIETENTGDSDADEADRKDNSWADWDDRVDLPAKSLLDAHVALSADECWAYMRTHYAFDIHAIRKTHNLDFYRTVVLINIIRHNTANSTCFACSKGFANEQELMEHFKREGGAHLQPPADGAEVWERKEFLKPAVEGDPLLMAFEDDGEDGEDDGADEETSRRILEESKKAVREKLSQLALDDSISNDNSLSCSDISQRQQMLLFQCYCKTEYNTNFFQYKEDSDTIVCTRNDKENYNQNGTYVCENYEQYDGCTGVNVSGAMPKFSVSKAALLAIALSSLAFF